MKRVLVGLEPDLSELVLRQLLLPPVFINKMPWTRGYFLTVDHQPLRPDDELSQYCFWNAARSRFAPGALAAGGPTVRRLGPVEL